MNIEPHSLVLQQSKVERNQKEQIRNILLEHDLTLPEWLALGFLYDQQSTGYHVGGIAAALDVQSTYITAVLRRLEKKGLVGWETGGADHRVRVYRATGFGLELIKNIDSSFLSELGGVQLSTEGMSSAEG